MEFFQKQIREIQDDAALRFYGAFISLCHVFSAIYWIRRRFFKDLAATGDPYCWPFFEDCFKYRFFSETEVYYIFIGFAVLGGIGSALFLFRRLCPMAYWWQVGLNVIKTVIYVQDFRLRMNQHYMLYFASLVFLFLPHKRDLGRYLLVFIYFGASLLKYNAEWTSGAALYGDPLFVPKHLIPASCVYVVILESFLVWGMLFKNRWVYWATFGQLILFHVVSWPLVGFFYPMLMFALLAIFPLTRFIEKDNGPSSLAGSFFRFKQPPAVYAVLSCFLFLQFIPQMFPGDSKITCEGRLFALHMFDARVFCQGNITLKFTDGAVKQLPIPTQKEPVRISCDPLVHFSRARRQCWLNRDNPNFLDLDLKYSARRGHQKSMNPLVDIADFCGQDLHYSMFRPNGWIIKK